MVFMIPQILLIDLTQNITYSSHCQRHIFNPACHLWHVPWGRNRIFWKNPISGHPAGFRLSVSRSRPPDFRNGWSDNSNPSCSSCPSWFLICSVLVTLIVFLKKSDFWASGSDLLTFGTGGKLAYL